MIDDGELRDIFKVASEEHLQNLDNGLLHLEKYPDDRTTLETLMREAHSLKGDANMLGIKEIGTLAHQIEHILSQLQQEQLSFSQELGDRIADGIGAIRKLVHHAVTGDLVEVNSFQVLATLMGGDRQAATLSYPEIKVLEENQSTDNKEYATILPEPYDRTHEELIDTQPNLTENTPTDSTLIEVCPDSELVIEANFTEQETLQLSNSESNLDAKSATHSASLNPANLSQIDSSLQKNRTHKTIVNHHRIETIRVKTHSLDTLMTQVGELTVIKIQIARRLAEVEAIANLWEEWSRHLLNHQTNGQRFNSFTYTNYSHDFYSKTHLEQFGQLINKLRAAFSEDINRLAQISEHLEEDIRTLRLLPLSTLFNGFPRMVRDLARQEGKQVDLIIKGGETCADKRIIEDMKDPLMHLLRNAIDHGIETPNDRSAFGKPATATIELRSYQTPTHIVIEIQDDGRGLDRERIQQTALKRGICQQEELAMMTSSQIDALIFTPGFSTAPLVTEISGRGVGLDVVQTNVEKLKGTIHVESNPGQGCLFRIQLGMTLATAHVLIVSVYDNPYAIPVEFVDTACLVDINEIFTLEGRDTIARENQPISVAPLADLLELRPPAKGILITQQPPPSQLICVTLKVGRQRFGVFVDDLIDEQDVVIKPQADILKRVRNVAGATILGTGEICTVLNPQDLMKTIQQRAISSTVKISKDQVFKKQTILLVEDSIATRTQEKRMLESAGYDVITAIDGNDGFQKLQSQSFDAIISDVQMPNLNGLELTTKIRQQHQFDEIPIILVTSLASDDDKRRGAEAGANAYITKDSLNQKMLIETLQRLI